MALEKELETYKKKLPELVNEEGKFILIHDGDVVDIISSYEDAMKEGYKKYGLNPFLVKEIHAIEQVQFISRDVNPCGYDAVRI